MPKFKDIAGHWAETDIRKLSEQGIIGGYPDGTFKPDQSITRAEVAAVIRRLWEQLKDPEAKRKHVIKQNKPAVVQIITERGRGTGSIIRADGLVLTCKHVVRDNQDTPPKYFETVRVKRITGESEQGEDYTRMYDAELVAVHERYDLALLKLKGATNLPIVTLAPVDFAPEEGDSVLAMGYSLGLHHRVSEGIISQDRALIPIRLMIDTTAAINAGNSGGPLIHVNSGLQIGVNTAKYETYAGRIVDNFAFAQPMVYVWEFLEQVGVEL